MYGIIFVFLKLLLVLLFYVFFNSESVLCGRLCGGYELLCENGV